ncbi:hypothetical protein [Microbispora bryophytorum]|uniref:Uncharacterized protein n=1 Tax=Microbispora bryophytorum subsp. camponoti TaxID=1677852 RepID=A0ABR8LDV4_9ACTN|nr:hypothetical protein [Microbispora camponoti]MBD3146708.1 hypothetical protein [Microbispora camponoti]
MSVIMLPGGVLRVPTATTLPNGTKVDGTREVRPDDPEYPHWLPYAQREAELWQRDEAEQDQRILARWRRRESA